MPIAGVSQNMIVMLECWSRCTVNWLPLNLFASPYIVGDTLFKNLCCMSADRLMSASRHKRTVQ